MTLPTVRNPLPFAREFYDRHFGRHLDWQLTGRWMLLSAAVGVLGALGALIFAFLVGNLGDLLLGDLVGYQMPLPGGEGGSDVPFDLANALKPTRRWLLFIVPAAGGLVSGWLVFTFAPEAEGHGTDAVIRAFHRNGGVIGPRVPIVKTLASAITIGTGGSAGREGPIAQIGAALASLLAQRLGLNERERRLLLMAGVAAGIGAIFQSPLGGAFFAVEVLYRRDMESEGLMPAVVAAITGYSVYSLVVGTSTVFSTPDFTFVHPLELLPLILFAMLCAVVGVAYVSIFYGTKERIFGRIPLPAHVKPALGGLLVGCIAFFFPAVLGSSYGWLQLAMNGALPLAIMGALVVTKIIATSLTIGSGGSGGVFAPSLVIGGMLGGLFGAAAHAVLPGVVTQPEAYVMIGMAAFFTGVANVPIATAIMISEMTGSYKLLLPILFSGVLVHLMVNRWSLYREQVEKYNESPAHRSEVIPDLLAGIRVGKVVEHPVHFHTLEAANTLGEILSVFTRTREVVLPVADGARYTGLVLLDDLQAYLQSNESLQHLIIATDLEVPFVSVSLDDSLQIVHEVFERTGYPELPITDAEGTIVAFMKQAQLVSEYHRAFLRTHPDRIEA